MSLSKQTISRRKNWIKGLTSGEFEQFTGALRNGATKEMCCLGVACEVYKRATGKGRWCKGEFLVDGQGSDARLPEPVAEYFGFSDTDPMLPGSTNPETASGCNDVLNLSFEQIAARIKRTMR